MVFPSTSADSSSSARSQPFRALVLLGYLAVLGAYANHFRNGFHFDDTHAIVDNVYIRQLSNIPLFFRDARTFSTMPSLQTWRPLLTTTFAVDYWIAGGLKPVVFQLSTFVWFTLLLGLIYVLYRDLLNAAAQRQANRYLAFFATALFGLHPVSAETVNYIYQRADLLSTLGVVAALVVYIRLPRWRRYGIYLVPAVLGELTKAPAVMFAPILFCYIWLFENGAERRGFGESVLKSVPAFVICGFFGWLDAAMNPKSFILSSTPHWQYWLAQPWAIARYVRSFFLPLWLTADSDLMPFTSATDPRAIVGAIFCLALLAATFACMRSGKLRTVAFGLLWFWLALVPTSVLVLGEVENDHRMFFPFVGLAFSVTSAVALAIEQWVASASQRRASILRGVQIAGVCILVACATGTYARNRVWHSDETLWRDVTLKSPNNGRGQIAYGLVLMNKGDTEGALPYFERAHTLLPNYYILDINLANAYASLNRGADAEQHFRAAIAHAPGEPSPYYQYGRWLRAQRRSADSIAQERLALQNNSADMNARYLLMRDYTDTHDWTSLRRVADETLALAPGDAETQTILEVAKHIEDVERAAAEHPTPEAYLDLAFACYRAGQFEQAVAAAQKAVALKSDFAEGYNNMAAAYVGLRDWDHAIEAAQHALKLKPDFQIAQNIVNYATNQKTLTSR